MAHDKQVIVTIGREFGSGGHEIADKIAEIFDIPLYDKEFFSRKLKEDEIIADHQELIDERSLSSFPVISMIDYAGWAEQGKIADAEFDFIKNEADEGNSFVVVGRCAEYILRGNPNKVSFFVMGDPDFKAKRVSEMYGMTEKEAYAACKNTDKMRKSYHNFYSTMKWGDSRAYDMCINSSRVGIENAVKVIEYYINTFMK